MSDPTPAPAPDPEEETAPAEVEPEAPEVAANPVNTAYQPEVVEADAEAAALVAEDTEPQLVDTEFTIMSHTDPARQRDPYGVYLDDIDRRNAEYRRAQAEGREPDYENAGPTAGDVVVPTAVAKQSFDGNAVVPVAFNAEVMVGSPAVEEESEEE